MSEPTLEELEAPLNPKQCQFAREYAIDFNAGKAYERAKYSKKGSGQAAHNLLKNTDVDALWKFHARRLAVETGTQAERVRRELASIGFGDLRDVMSWGEDGVLYRDSSDISDEAAACISEVESITTTRHSENGDSVETVKMKMKQHSKVAALVKLGEMDAMFTQKVAFEGSEDGALTVVLKTAVKE